MIRPASFRSLRLNYTHGYPSETYTGTPTLVHCAPSVPCMSTSSLVMTARRRLRQGRILQPQARPMLQTWQQLKAVETTPAWAQR